jgi:hypothetical protein
MAGVRVGERPAKVFKNENVAQPRLENINRNENPVGAQPDRRREGNISQPATPRQDFKKEEQRQVQPRRESTPRQMETRPSRPAERSAQPTYSPPSRPQPQQAPRQAAPPSNSSPSERRGRR